MLNYIRFNEDAPIKNQLPQDFKSVAILFHPFIQMPIGWEQTKRKNPYEHIYPSDEEILKYGKPVLWEKIISDCELNNTKELAIALMTAISGLKKEYSRPDLAEKLNLQSDVYFPSEDSISVVMLDDILKVLSLNGAKSFYYSEPIFDKNGWIEISETNALQISKITRSEIFLSDENMDFAFMSIYDSFITLFLSKNESIENIVEKMNWESIICGEDTTVNWYLHP